MMRNLLKETESDIQASGHKVEDILFIGSEESGHSCTWEEFKVLADFEYDAGYGAQEVAEDLIIVFKDGTKMWRYEYDGSESYSSPFSMPEVLKPIKTLSVVGTGQIGWCSLDYLNNPEKADDQDD